MLHAIVHSKAGRIEIEGASIPVREIYKGREDMLTAAVFARLSYLNPEVRNQCFTACLPNSRHLFDSLVKVEYWPSLSSKIQTRVEPDVVLHFDWGIMVVEVKRPQDGWHTAEQWSTELDAVKETHHGKTLMLLALGGNEYANQIELKRLKAMMASDNKPDHEYHALTWPELATELGQLQSSVSTSDQRIIADIFAALKLYGVDPAARPPLDTLSSRLPSRKAIQSLAILQQWSIFA